MALAEHEGVNAALIADADWQDGWFVTPAAARLPGDGPGLCQPGMSQAIYREEIWRKIGFSSLEDSLIGSSEANFRRRDANDLSAMRADCADLRFGQDLGPYFRFTRPQVTQLVQARP